MNRGEYGYFFLPRLNVTKYHRNPIKISNNNIQVPNKCWLIHKNTDFFLFYPPESLEKTDYHPTRFYASFPIHNSIKWGQ